MPSARTVRRHQLRNRLKKKKRQPKQSGNDFEVLGPWIRGPFNYGLGVIVRCPKGKTVYGHKYLMIFSREDDSADMFFSVYGANPDRTYTGDRLFLLCAPYTYNKFTLNEALNIIKERFDA